MEERLGRLEAAAAEAAPLQRFIDAEFRPTWGHEIENARHAIARLGMDAAEGLAADLRALSPSDFGIHNALRRRGGHLVFLDFEYLGWDDP